MTPEPHIDQVARILAEANGLEWRAIQGTGPQGEITEADVLDALSAELRREKEASQRPKAAQDVGSGPLGWLRRIFG